MQNANPAPISRVAPLKPGATLFNLKWCGARSKVKMTNWDKLSISNYQVSMNYQLINYQLVIEALNIDWTRSVDEA